jgi:hypothetical protein
MTGSEARTPRSRLPSPPPEGGFFGCREAASFWLPAFRVFVLWTWKDQEVEVLGDLYRTVVRCGVSCLTRVVVVELS